MADALFSWVERVHAGAGPWGEVLDAGTGDHSLGWLHGLAPRALTAVTVEQWRMEGLRRIAPGAEILLGQWTDPLLLAGRAFDAVVVDYVIGAIDGHAPYFQYDFLERLQPHLKPGGRIYLIGMEPPPRDGSGMDEVCRVRDACILLAGHRCYREYPRAVVEGWVGRAGFSVIDSTSIPNRLGRRFIEGQLSVARTKLGYLKDRALAATLEAHIAGVQERAMDGLVAGGGWRVWGADWVIAAGR